jgi:hypothetical protein
VAVWEPSSNQSLLKTHAGVVSSTFCYFLRQSLHHLFSHYPICKHDSRKAGSNVLTKILRVKQLTNGTNAMRETRMPRQNIGIMGVPCHSWSGIIFHNRQLITRNTNDL